MPKLSTGMPKMRNVKGYAQVSIHGKNHHLGKWGSKQAKEKYALLLTEWKSSAPRVRDTATGCTINEILLAYVKLTKAEHGDKSHQFYSISSVAKLLGKYGYGETLASEFGPKRLKQFREAMVRDDHSRQYTNDIAKRFKIVMKWAASEEMIDGSIVVNLQTVQGLKRKRSSKARESPEIPPVADSVIEATIKHIVNPRVVDMVKLHRLLGCRPTELCEMKPKHIDRTGEVWTYSPEHHKTEDRGKSRDIVIGPRAQEILTAYLLRGEDDWCFESLPGRCFSKDSYRTAVQRAAKLAFPTPDKWKQRSGESAKERNSRLARAGERTEFERWRKQYHWAPNQLRHSRATEIRKHHGLEAAQVALGHASADITQIYAERDHELARQVATKSG